MSATKNQQGELADITQALAQDFVAHSPLQRLQNLRARVAGRIVFTTSLGIEDQAILHLIANAGLDIEIVTLDTGRLFGETYRLWRESEQHYGLRIRACYPQGEVLEELVARQGIDGFYESVAARHACCHVRKVEPLGRALAGAKAWVTGLRADASHTRGSMNGVEFDRVRNLIKLSPLFDWSRDQVAAFTTRENVPVNALHAQGFISIGCAPCTRAIAPGEDERAGRWWWENDAARECGLHVDDQGHLVRATAPQEQGTGAVKGPFQ